MWTAKTTTVFVGHPVKPLSGRAISNFQRCPSSLYPEVSWISLQLKAQALNPSWKARGSFLLFPFSRSQGPIDYAAWLTHGSLYNQCM